jgi:hypothetical protein
MKIKKVKMLSTTISMKGSPFYISAHNGDLSASFNLIDHLIADFSRFNQFKGYVCPVQRYAGNLIPYALACRIVQNSDGKLCDTVFLTSGRPGNSMMDRMSWEPDYQGDVPMGRYILVDDVITTGITLKGLKSFIESRGSEVSAVYTLGSSRSGGLFEPSRLQYRFLISRYPDIDRYFNSADLTSPQISYLLRFNSLLSYFNLFSSRQYQRCFNCC